MFRKENRGKAPGLREANKVFKNVFKHARSKGPRPENAPYSVQERRNGIFFQGGGG